MDPLFPFDVAAAVWGVLGAVANLGVLFVEATRRVKGWP
ncbi:hypothetical protein FB471_4896 [Amycolatopsis cihanbeyliensis]|uniref:Uncharacterized protein n=1 Tax=Amycolatopsis cihanbeyliensis TaxID=1128664 RepID=A0A542DPP2_AMYCI|nr:hypothetical protein FB471_4896 [Amycolatopsis cihanbeyliensis]